MSAPTDSKTRRTHLASASNGIPSNTAFSNFPPNGNGRSAEQKKVAVICATGNLNGRKRKRLSKACDACHQSKRRCDGTSPCDNCYYASKHCTYTDASGKPIPAPRSAHLERPASVATAQPSTEITPWAGQATLSSPPVNLQGVERNPTMNRSRQVGSDSSPPLSSKNDTSSGTFTYPSDPAVTHELVNIFFAHCNPQRMIIHQPSFSADLTLSKIPPYLVLAVCAVAAPLSTTVASAASHRDPRLAGVPFFHKALNIMFDGSGRLLCEPTVSAVQALCLLEMHEIAASHSWTRQFKYLELALKVLEGSLYVQQPDNSTPPSPTDSGPLMRFIDRECTRRCFWLILFMEWIRHIYTHQDVLPRMTELADVVRLPIDETSFELAPVTNLATCEYLRQPAPQTSLYTSQFGHVLRILEIYHNIENVLTNQEGPARAMAIAPLRRQLEDWFASLPSHLQFNEKSLETQVTMFETSSTSGAWSFFFIHAMYPCCYLAVLEGEGTLSDPIPSWIRGQLNIIFNAAGTRAKTSIPSACALWSYSKYVPDDPNVHVWDREFEKLWGFKVVVVAQQWRASQAEIKEDKARRRQQQQQQQQPQCWETAGSESSSNSTTSSHYSPAAVKLQAQLYENRRDGNPSALLRANVSMSVPDARSEFAASRTSLPSLEQAGLLDALNMKVPPFESFTTPLLFGCGTHWRSLHDSPPTTDGGGAARSEPNTGLGSANAIGSLLPNMNWFVDGVDGGATCSHKSSNI